MHARRKVKQALGNFFREMELEVEPLAKNATKQDIRHRIKKAHFYLGDIEKDQTGDFDSHFLRRLDHPNAAHLNTRGQLIRGRVRRRRRRNNTARGIAMKLFRVCSKISDARPRYVYGGGHGPLLRLMRSNANMDCSSSTSLALKRAGMFSFPIAWVSGMFGGWGQEGKGDWFTVCWHSGHVFIEFYNLPNKGDYYRFDTSPWGDGESGARLRDGERGYAQFKFRHLPGL